MDSEYKSKLKDLIIKMLELINAEMAGEDPDKLRGIGPVAMLVGAQAVCFHSGYTYKDMEDLQKACVDKARLLLDEWNIELPTDKVAGDQTYYMQPDKSKYKN